MPWKCYWMEETGDVNVRLRRYVSDSTCPGGYHSAWSEVIDRQPRRVSPEGHLTEVPVEEFKGHKAWPKTCQNPGCDYRFKKADNWQVWTDRVYRRAATGEEFGGRGLPPGSLLDATWNPDSWRRDGVSLMVVLPPTGEDTRGHWWCADGPSSDAMANDRINEQSWSRTGDPRHPETLTTSPSILTDSYHGFLQAGFLTDSLGDRPLPPGPD